MKKMKKAYGLMGPLLVLSALAIAGCATSGPAAKVAAGSGPVVIRARDFAFSPNVVDVKGKGPLTFAVTNDSGTTHNLTIQDPAGKVIAGVELPPRQTTNVTADLAMDGTYKFWCNKPLHAALGMTGRIVVTG